METTTTLADVFTKGSIFAILLLNIAAGYLLVLVSASILFAISKVLLITPTILRLFKIRLEQGEPIDRSLIILLYTHKPELESTIFIRALWPILRAMQTTYELGEALEDFSIWLHLDVKAILGKMADTAKRSMQASTLSLHDKPSRARKPRPEAIDTYLANQHRSLQIQFASEASDNSFPTPSSIYSTTASELEDPFADQPHYRELPLPRIRLRSPARCTPYPRFPQRSPSAPVTALPQPPTPYSAAITPITKSMNQWISDLQHADITAINTTSTTDFPYAQSTRLASLVSNLSRLDTSVAEYGPYNRDWEFRSPPEVTGRWEHFERESQVHLAYALMGRFGAARPDVPMSGGDYWGSDEDSDYESEQEDDSGSDSDNGWRGLPSPASSLDDPLLKATAI
ncbi:hypothetical protein PMZ80_006671 [Knufia obscura]|uniref:Uncharacterized protein n=1 Tax=Knufia obscura TaxID=1635080 RepID=A0ABR0RMD6_9EURO|nr:hypothetical protein PMZ80_006671 [Knufia obscura]